MGQMLLGEPFRLSPIIQTFQAAGVKVSGELYGKYWSSDMEKSGRGPNNVALKILLFLEDLLQIRIWDT
jgi:hypothetical protein